MLESSDDLYLPRRQSRAPEYATLTALALLAAVADRVRGRDDDVGALVRALGRLALVERFRTHDPIDLCIARQHAFLLIASR